ncbi:hypothetical protein [Neolewinella litorea]|uniref:Uncharacterized protein n=1 Tax=Neolewinella litorea TaxID=2562452 RepID=A0A4S4NNG3_9BACT|nr:hypothetical protein [Neolewinella litorea]THH41392.1 hypothetical protein E4021_01985 [Neolewinella litorea]
MRHFFVTILSCCCLLMNCTSDPPPQGAVALQLSDIAFTADGRFLDDAAGPELLIGVDAYSVDYTAEELLQLVERLQVNGGNYLRLNPVYLDSSKVITGLAKAVTRGLIVDTLKADAMAVTVQSVASFNRELLDGNGRVAYPSFSQRALNGLRAVRTVEQKVSFSALRRSNDILGPDNPTGATAAADTSGNFLIYVPTAGRVTFSLPDGRQQPVRRVTVVGHLGTQRSEILRPPYDRRFTLTSNEAKGGWMVIERLE